MSKPAPEKCIEALYLKKRRQMIYLPLEDIDLVWDERDLPKVRELWEQNFSVWEIAEEFNRDPIAVAVLIIDQARQDKIKRRPWGMFGRESEYRKWGDET